MDRSSSAVNDEISQVYNLPGLSAWKPNRGEVTRKVISRVKKSVSDARNYQSSDLSNILKEPSSWTTERDKLTASVIHTVVESYTSDAHAQGYKEADVNVRLNDNSMHPLPPPGPRANRMYPLPPPCPRPNSMHPLPPSGPITNSIHPLPPPGPRQSAIRNNMARIGPERMSKQPKLLVDDIRSGRSPAHKPQRPVYPSLDYDRLHSRISGTTSGNTRWCQDYWWKPDKNGNRPRPM